MPGTRLVASASVPVSERAAMHLSEHPLDRQRLGVHQARVGDRTRPTDGQAERHRTRFEPQVAGQPDAFHVVDGEDLVRLGQQDAEATRREPRDVVRLPGVPPDGVGDGDQDLVGRELTERRHEPVEAIELDHDDRDGSLVAGVSSVLVRDEPIPVPQAEQAGERVGQPPDLFRVRRGRAQVPATDRRRCHRHTLAVLEARLCAVGRWGCPCPAASQLRPHDGNDDEDDIRPDEDRQKDQEVVGWHGSPIRLPSGGP